MILVYRITLEVWKCGNVEICLHCLYLITLKCGNVPPLSLSINTGSVEMWRNVSSLSLFNNSGSVEIWKCVWDDLAIENRTGARRNDALLPIAVNRKTVTWLVSEHRPAAYFCCLFGRKMDGVLVQNLTVAGLAFKKYDWRPSKHEDVLHKGF